MKVKLQVIEKLPLTESIPPLAYQITDGKLDRWTYSPPRMPKAAALHPNWREGMEQPPAENTDKEIKIMRIQHNIMAMNAYRGGLRMKFQRYGC